MNTLSRSLFILLITLMSLPAMAQDSLAVQGEPIPIEKTYASRYDPRRAILLAAVFPGAGQIYNKKYWKLPLVYGGFAGLGYAIWWNQDRYIFYRKGLFALLNEPATPVVLPGSNLTQYGNVVINGKAYYPVGTRGYLGLDVARTAVNRYRRDRDFSMIMCFLLYVMQMVDAHVDAHLKEFDLNPQLKVSIDPSIKENAFYGRSTGIGLTLRF